MDELSLASPQSPGLGFTRPAGATYRVQESRWAEIWGPPRVPATPARRWLRERHALLARTNLGNRFADPLGHYRETYSADCLVGALTECWADDVPHDATALLVGGCEERRPLRQDRQGYCRQPGWMGGTSLR